MERVNVYPIFNNRARNGGYTLAYFFNTRQKNEDTSWNILRGSDVLDERGN